MLAPMRNPMFVFDERTTDLVLSYCRERLALDPVPLDYGGYATDFSQMLDGIIGNGGNDPAKVLDLFAESLSTAVVSIDSPRFLSFIPAAPTKAALLFDMVVSSSSLNGASWLLAAGVVARFRYRRQIAPRADLEAPDHALQRFAVGREILLHFQRVGERHDRHHVR